MTPTQKWLSREEVAERLGVSQWAIDNYRRRHGLPAHKMPGRAGRVVFDPDEVDALVRGQGSDAA